MSRQLLAVLLVLLVAARLHAQEWESLDGPPSGEVLATLLRSDGTLVAGTAAKGLFYRLDGSSEWIRSSTPVFDGLSVRALIEFDGMIVAGTDRNGIYASVDGESWLPVNVGLKSFAIYDFLESHTGRLFAATGSGLHRFDSGEWSDIFDLASESIRTIAENDLGHLFVGAFSTGIFRSLDDGQTWSLTGQGLATNTIRSLAVGPENELYVGTFGGDLVQKSIDNGENWTAASEGLQSTGVWTVDTGPDGRLLAGSVGSGISYSDDAGASWTVSSAPSTAVTAVNFSADGTVWAASRAGLLRSEDGGETWITEGIPYSRVNKVVAIGDRLVAGTSLSGLQYSDDEGATWRRSNVDAELVLSIERGRDGALYASTWEGHVYRSIDSGAIWTSMWKTIRVTYSVAADEDGRVMVGTESGIYTQDGEGGWDRVGLEGIRVWSIVVDSDDVFYAGTEGNGVFRSADAGATWVQLSGIPLLFSESVGSLRVTPDGLLAATRSTQGGVWVSSDGGDTWEPTLEADDVVMSDLAIGPAGQLLGAGFIGQVFQLSPGVRTWSRVGPRFNITPIRSVAALADGSVYIGTDPVGLHRLEKGLSISTEEIGVPPSVRLDVSVYPNPATNQSTVAFEVSRPGPTTLEVFDALGRRVWVDRWSVAGGMVERALTGETFVPGLYHVRLTSPDGKLGHTTFVVVD